MKYLILLLIKIYQWFISKHYRRKCLFRESCSNYVFRIIKEKGIGAGVKALEYRTHNCKPNYFLIKNDDKILLITAQNEVLEEEFIDEQVLIEVQKN